MLGAVYGRADECRQITGEEGLGSGNDVQI
jgi:hypothetical protein